MQATVGIDQNGTRLAAFLRTMRKDLSWSDARGHIAHRRVRVNRVLCLDDARMLRSGDVVELLEQSGPSVPKQGDVKIVYRDDDLLVIDKPAGMQCERRIEEKHWDAARKARQPAVVEVLEKTQGRVYPVHRLDRETSGLMLYARTPKSQQLLIAAMAAHQVQRTYLAVVIGRIASGTIRSWLVRDRGDGLRGSGAADAPGAREAVTHFTVKQHVGDRYTLVECRLETGRTHQIRIHLAEAGHPVCGEKIYLRPRPGAEAVIDPSHAHHHALHSASLRLQHPLSGHPLSFTSPLPAELTALIPR